VANPGLTPQGGFTQFGNFPFGTLQAQRMPRRFKIFLTELSARLPARLRSRLLDFASFLLHKVWRPLRRALPFHLLRRLPVSSLVLGPPKDLCATTEDLCRQIGPPAAYTPMHGPHKITRQLPATLTGGSHPAFASILSIEAPRTFLARVPGARVYGECGAVITPDDRLLADVSFEITREEFTHSVFSRLRMPRPVELRGTSAVIASIGRMNYFHWMLDVLPRLALLRSAGVAWSEVQHFLVGEWGSRFQEESFRVLGIPLDCCVPCGPSAHFRCEDLLIPSPPGRTGHPPRWACEFLRETFLPDAAIAPQIPASGGGRKIYVSRSGARFRRVLNEDEVIRRLEGEGFEAVLPEKLTVHEQARLFASADVVVAPHGAGCTNVVFCRPGTAFVEIFAPRYVMACYWTVSSQCGLRYAYDLGRLKEAPSGGHYFTMIEDIDVDCERLLRTIALCTSSPLATQGENADTPSA